MTVGRLAGEDDRGSALVEFTWFTLLAIVPFVYALLALFDVQRAAFGVSAASSAAARAFLASGDVASAYDRARHASDLALADHGLADADVSIVCEPACFEPGSRVRVRVRLRADLPLMPSIMGDSLGSIAVESTHLEPYGSYRAGR